MIPLLFQFSFSSSVRFMPQNLKHVVQLHQKPVKTLAPFGTSPLGLHQYAFAGHQSPVKSFLSLSPGPLLYEYSGSLSRFGSFAGRFRLYARADLDVHSSLRRSGSVRSSSLFLFAHVEVSARRCFVPPMRHISSLTLSSGHRFCGSVWYKLRRNM